MGEGEERAACLRSATASADSRGSCCCRGVPLVPRPAAAMSWIRFGTVPGHLPKPVPGIEPAHDTGRGLLHFQRRWWHDSSSRRVSGESFSYGSVRFVSPPSKGKEGWDLHDLVDLETEDAFARLPALRSDG